MTPTREGVEGPGRSEPQIPMRGVRERTEEVLGEPSPSRAASRRVKR